MNKHSSLSKGSLIERATEIYDFSAALQGRAAPAVEVPVGEQNLVGWRAVTIAGDPSGSPNCLDGKAQLRVQIPDARRGLVGSEDRSGMPGQPFGQPHLVVPGQR